MPEFGNKFFAIRAGTQDDEGFVAQCWVREFRCSSWKFRRTDDGVFNSFCYPRIREHLKTSTVRVAGPIGDSLTIYGFVVFNEDLLHLVHVRKEWRKKRIATALLEGMQTEDKLWTTDTEDWNGRGQGHGWAQHKWKTRGHFPFWMTELPKESHAATRSSEAVAQA